MVRRQKAVRWVSDHGSLSGAYAPDTVVSDDGVKPRLTYMVAVVLATGTEVSDRAGGHLSL